MSQTYIKTLLVASFLISLILLILGVLPSASAAVEADDMPEGSEEASGITVSEIPMAPRSTILQLGTGYTAPKGPITVPVYPRGDTNKALPQSTDLRDSYIVMEDGSVLSAAGWILGALNKDQAGADMSDYEMRLFLGQVARVAVGMDEAMVNYGFLHTEPAVAHPPNPALPAPLQALQVVVNLVKSAILPGRPYDWDASKSGGAFSPTMKSKGDSTYLFDRQFTEAMDQTNSDLREAGTMQNMIRDQKKLLAKQAVAH
ncbi:MAG: hypothetical protein KUG56_06810 [Kordiimonadaceae bacterium]|nr:hypothetical protein [Kordiimonadaceae bacterium]